MGNNQTSTKSPGPSSTGISSSFSFLGRQRSQSTRRSQIIVVNAAGQQILDPKDDEHIKRLKETPKFMPMLKGCLPGYRDSSEIYKKIDSKPFIKFANRFQAHLSSCSKVVGEQQQIIFSRIIQTDQAMTSITNKLIQNSKYIDKLSEELKKVKELQEKLDTIDLFLQEIVPSIETLNELLPENERLPPLTVMPTSIYSSIGNSSPSTPAVRTSVVMDNVEQGEEV